MRKTKHHFIPASYLSGFSTELTRRGRLTIFDKKEAKSYVNTCENVGYKKRYYKIDIDGMDEDAVENAFAEVEGAAIRIIRNTVDKLIVPDGEDYKVLMFYLALMASRIPAIRDNIDSFMSEIIKTTGKVYFNSARLDEMVNNLKDRGVDLGDGTDIEELKNFVIDGDYDVSIDQSYNIGIALHMAQIISELLHQRTWNLFYRTDNMSNYFVTSDCPLLLTWSDDRAGPYPPGFALNNTRVIFPLNRDVVLIGEFEIDKSVPIRVRNRTISLLNAYQVYYSKRFIYSYTPEFCYFRKDREMCSSDSLLKQES